MAIPFYCIEVKGENWFKKKKKKKKKKIFFKDLHLNPETIEKFDSHRNKFSVM